MDLQHHHRRLSQNIIVMIIFLSFCANIINGDDNSGGGGGVLNEIKNSLLKDTAANVFDWVFGDPNDAKQYEHELEEHFSFLDNRIGNNVESKNSERSWAQLAESAGIKPQFFNFKAHDYDDNDRIDGLELMALILNEKVHEHDDRDRFRTEQDMANQINIASGNDMI